MNRTVTLLSIVFTLATNAVQAYEWQALPDKARYKVTGKNSD